MVETEKKLGFFEKYLTAWVVLCIIFGILLGRLNSEIAEFLNTLQIYQISLPIAICLFFMIYPIMVQIDFKKVVEAGKTPKPVALTLVINWLVKPFTMVFFAWLFMKVIFAHLLNPVLAESYIAGMILLGVAPCTAMVLVWSYLSKGNMGHTLVMVAINSLTMLLLYAPLAGLLLNISDIVVPWETIGLSVGIYVGIPLLVGYVSRTQILKRKGKEWFETSFAPSLHYVAIVALLITLILLFSLQGGVIVDQPLIIAMIFVPLFLQNQVIFWITYLAAKGIGLPYEDAAPSAQIGASNHFEIAIAVAIMLFGISSGAALATVVGVLMEVPVMLLLVKVSLKTQQWFPKKG
jgi:arsenite transporter